MKIQQGYPKFQFCVVLNDLQRRKGLVKEVMTKKMPLLPIKHTKQKIKSNGEVN